MSNDKFMKQVFIEGRTHRIFKDRPVDESLLHRLYELAKIAPSSSNLCPMRISFVVSMQQKQKVIDAAAEGNKPKIESAPVVAIVAHDIRFTDHIEKLAPFMNASLRSAPNNMVSLRLALLRLAPIKLALSKCALLRLAS